MRMVHMPKEEYYYCLICKKIRYRNEVEVDQKGLKCLACGGYELIEPIWVICPHRKEGGVKCPLRGEGIKAKAGIRECEYRCAY
jgi:hypothetical protein